MSFANRQECRDKARAMNKASLFDPDHWYDARRNHVGEHYVAKIHTASKREVERFYS